MYKSNNRREGLVETFQIQDNQSINTSFKIKNFMANKQVIVGSLLAIALILIFMTSSSPLPEPKSANFQEWKANYGMGLNWSKDEEQYRKQIFQINLGVINKHNLNEESTYTMGINKFTIYTPQEFSQKFLMTIPFAETFGLPETDKIFNGIRDNTNIIVSSSNADTKQPANVRHFQYDRLTALPNSDIDWSINKVTPVKNQGICGSCYSFATIALIQSFYMINSSTITDLSEQQIIDCSTVYGNSGCEGGNYLNTLKFVMNYGGLNTNPGLTTQASYPYVGRQTTCKFTGGSNLISAGYYYYGYSNGQSYLKTALKTSPVAVYVNATSWQTYSGGILNNQVSHDVNHGALLVGLIKNKVWKLKNSWGTGWGENGYIRMNGTNICGISLYPGYTVA